MSIIGISHPLEYQVGVRTLMLTGRHKDGVEHDRKLLRISYNDIEFQKQLGSLIEQLQPGERIYASAGRRDVNKAMRLFKERQLATDYDPQPLKFYQRLETAWFAALMSPNSQEKKVWLFDCDSQEDFVHVANDLDEVSFKVPLCNMYDYPTKTGFHIVINPFNKSLLTDRSRSMLHQNPYMLWVYAE